MFSQCNESVDGQSFGLMQTWFNRRRHRYCPWGKKIMLFFSLQIRFVAVYNVLSGNMYCCDLPIFYVEPKILSLEKNDKCHVWTNVTLRLANKRSGRQKGLFMAVYCLGICILYIHLWCSTRLCFAINIWNLYIIYNTYIYYIYAQHICPVAMLGAGW